MALYGGNESGYGGRIAYPRVAPRRVAAPRQTPAKPAFGQQPAGTPPPGQQGGAGTPSGNPWDSDPVLQQIQASINTNIANAEHAALKERQRQLIQFGYDPTLGNIYGDAATSQLAKNNQFSVLANLLRAHQLAQTNINEDYNKNNLFWGGHRGLALSQEGTGYLGQQSAANNALRNALAGIDTNLLNYKSGQQGRGDQALTDAYNRYLSTHPIGGAGAGVGTTGTRTATAMPAGRPTRNTLYAMLRRTGYHPA